MLYMLTIVGGAGGVEDLAGNDLATNIFSSFTTLATPRRYHAAHGGIGHSPAGASTGVATSTPVTVTFSEALMPRPVSRRARSGCAIRTTTSCPHRQLQLATKTATLTPTSPRWRTARCTC